MTDRLKITTALLGCALLVGALGACKERQRPSNIPEPKAPASQPSTVYHEAENGRYRTRSEDKQACFVVGFEPQAPKVGELFTAHTQVLGPGCKGLLAGEAFTMDATMPDHAHGMMTRPVHAEVTPGTWTTKGMKFHMPGYWKIDLKSGDHEAIIHWHQDPIAK